MTHTPRSEAAGHRPLSFSDLALQSQSYSAVVTTTNSDDDLSPASTDSSVSQDHHIAQSTGASLHEESIQHPGGMTLTDKALDNVTYDTILAATARGLRLDLNAQYLHAYPSPLPSTDARAPPNTPASPLMNCRYGSLASASAKIVESD